jgi:hypothetical protein
MLGDICVVTGLPLSEHVQIALAAMIYQQAADARNWKRIFPSRNYDDQSLKGQYIFMLGFVLLFVI